MNENILEIIKKTKDNKTEIPIYNGYLKPVESNYETISLLKEWREKNQIYFPSIFKVTEKGTKSWLENIIIKKEDNILFMINNIKDIPIGHLGLSNLNSKHGFYEIGNFIRGRKETKGIMTFAGKGLCTWAFSELNINRLILKVFSDNEKAIKLYKRCGFESYSVIPMKRINNIEGIFYEQTTGWADRYFKVMERIK